MADVTINYRSTAIATMNASGSVSLDTSGKYCDSDIEVVYEQPSGGASWTVANATRDTSYQGAVFTAPSGCTAVPAAYILYTTAAMSSVSGSPAITILKDSTHNLMWYYESGSVKVKTVSTGDFSVWYQNGKIYFDDDNTYGLASNTNVGLICVYGQAGTVSFRTKTHTPASNSTTATFATEEEPAMFVCGLDATVSLNSTHKVQTVVYSDDVNVFSGTNFYTSNIGYYTNFTKSYSSSTFTLTSYSSGTSGYFNSGSQYTLYYLLSGDLSNSTNLGEKTITQNGTYNASSDGYDGYSSVTVNVSGGIDINDLCTGAGPTGAVTITANNIKERLFKSCTNITSVTANNVTTIREQIFNGCTSLQSISFTGATSVNSSQQFMSCKALTSIDLPNLTAIAGNMFQACTNLEIVDLPKVTSLNNARGFYGCSKLKTIILRYTNGVVPLQNETLASTPFAGAGGLTGTLYVPSALVASYKTASNWATLFNNGTMTVTAIEGSIYA